MNQLLTTSITKHRTGALLAAIVSLAAAAGCYTGSPTDTNRQPSAPQTEVENTEPTEEEIDGGSNAEEPAGLPCDVADILEKECHDCHGAKPSGGAKNSILTFEDLVAPSVADPSTNVAELSLARMQSSKRPMPPSGKLTTKQITIFEDWIAEGMPRGTCGAKKPPAKDAGPSTPAKDSGTTPPKDSGPPPVTSVCTSGKHATIKDPAGPTMKPGRSCIKCHSATGGPTFEIAGTVFPTLHEPNDCHGIDDGTVKVLIIDASGTTHQLPVNEVGNFMLAESFPRPYKAIVVRGNEIREMMTPQTDGDCNGCHTELGTNSAPGRVMTP